MKCTFIIETDQPDRNGNVLLFDGLTIPDKVFVTDNFESNKLPIAVAKVLRDEGILKATAELPDEYLDRFPAIGFVTKKYKDTGRGKIWEETKLNQIGLCETENLNPTIKAIREQMKDQK